MIFHDMDDDTKDIEELSFFNFLVIKGYNYTKDINKLAKSFGHYYYCYCRDNGYRSQNLAALGCKKPFIMEWYDNVK